MLKLKVDALLGRKRHEEALKKFKNFVVKNYPRLAIISEMVITYDPFGGSDVQYPILSFYIMEPTIDYNVVHLNFEISKVKFIYKRELQRISEEETLEEGLARLFKLNNVSETKFEKTIASIMEKKNQEIK